MGQGLLTSLAACRYLLVPEYYGGISLNCMGACSVWLDSLRLPLLGGGMAPGRCSCGGWYQGNGVCSNGVDGVNGVHKGPGWARRHSQRTSATVRLSEVAPPPRPVVLPSARCFVIPCPQRTVWLVTGLRHGSRSTVPACHAHLVNLLREQVVQVEQVRRLSPRRSRSVDRFFPR